MRHHAYADLFPMMTDQEHAALCEDIKANGLLEPIVVYRELILDGRTIYLWR